MSLLYWCFRISLLSSWLPTYAVSICTVRLHIPSHRSSFWGGGVYKPSKIESMHLCPHLRVRITSEGEGPPNWEGSPQMGVSPKWEVPPKVGEYPKKTKQYQIGNLYSGKSKRKLRRVLSTYLEVHISILVKNQKFSFLSLITIFPRISLLQSYEGWLFHWVNAPSSTLVSAVFHSPKKPKCSCAVVCRTSSCQGRRAPWPPATIQANTMRKWT